MAVRVQRGPINSLCVDSSRVCRSQPSVSSTDISLYYLSYASLYALQQYNDVKERQQSMELAQWRALDWIQTGQRVVCVVADRSLSITLVRGRQEYFTESQHHTCTFLK